MPRCDRHLLCVRDRSVNVEFGDLDKPGSKSQILQKNKLDLFT